MRIVLLGPPGAGKGTQARILAERLSVPALSSGDLFRAEIRQGTDLGRLAQQYTRAGRLVPDEVTNSIMTRRVDEPDAAAGFLLDGFPRTVRQAELLDEALAERRTVIDVVFALELPDEEAVHRMTGRRVCGRCGLTVHVVLAPPRTPGICDACAGDLIRRDDDSEETVRRRLDVYHEQTAPLTEWYGSRGVLVPMDAAGPTQHVLRQLLTALPAARP